MSANAALHHCDETNPLSEQLKDELIVNNANGIYLAHIVGAAFAGHSVLPTHLGLNAPEYAVLITSNFKPGFDARVAHYRNEFAERGALRQNLLEMRRDEWADVRTLLLAEKVSPTPIEQAFASIVAAACMGGGHLWRDLGLPTRAMLRELLSHYFPKLAARNDRDMRWKKFFYRQLCEQEGGVVCRSPSCETCSNYDECFGDET